MLAPGTRLGPYEVLAPLGAGGMGEVFRAHDPRLDREVAIKVLPEEFVSDRERRERFEREAKALAAVSHPNIASIYSFEEVSGRCLLVQELLEGETLREILREGPLPPRKAAEVGAQIADGLAAAHAKGIVHRDLKPENVVVTREGRVKILDFGLAKRVAISSAVESNSPTEARATTPGEVLGTVGYLAPEQVRGHPADARTDLFALGCVLYEMLSGKRSFQRETAAETMAAVLREDPPPLENPPELSVIVLRCLEKKPEARFQSAQDLAFALRSLASGPTPAGRLPVTTRHPSLSWLLAGAAAFVLVAVAIGVLRGRGPSPQPPPEPPGPTRIVVLPFENLGSPEDAYFADGMTEEITSRLASVKSLAVISRTTATQYDRKGKSVQQVGKDLGVGYVLEGSVRWDKSGSGPGRVRITPQLIRVSDDTHLWADRYERELANVFAIQGDVADGVVGALGLALAPAESTALRRMPTRDLEAYDFYLRALAPELKSQRRSAIAEKLRLAAAAVEKDPRFAEALALLANQRLSNYWFYYDRSESQLERARAEAELAVSLRPDVAETHVALGRWYYVARLDYESALAEYEKARALQPNDAGVQAVIAVVWRRQGRMEEAEAGLRKAVDGDPLNAQTRFNLGQIQSQMRRYPDAIRTLEFLSTLDPTYVNGYSHRAWIQVLWKGDVSAAEEVLQAAASVPSLEDPAGLLDYDRFRMALLARNGDAALRLAGKWRSGDLSAESQYRYLPPSLLRAQALSILGRGDAARAFWEEARKHLAQKAAEAPDDPRLHSSLGIALAGLGRTAEAVREGERGVELMPLSRDAYRGTYRAEDLALIHTMLGSAEAAIRQLEILLSRPSFISVPLLRIDPRWDPLRKNPKFEALLAKYDVQR